MSMTPRLLAQLSWVCNCDAAALEHEHAWPPVTPAAAELEQAEHLRAIGRELDERARRGGFRGGLDAAFGEAR